MCIAPYARPGAPALGPRLRGRRRGFTPDPARSDAGEGVAFGAGAHRDVVAPVHGPTTRERTQSGDGPHRARPARSRRDLSVGHRLGESLQRPNPAAPRNAERAEVRRRQSSPALGNRWVRPSAPDPRPPGGRTLRRARRRLSAGRSGDGHLPDRGFARRTPSSNGSTAPGTRRPFRAPNERTQPRISGEDGRVRWASDRRRGRRGGGLRQRGGRGRRAPRGAPAGARPARLATFHTSITFGAPPISTVRPVRRPRRRRPLPHAGDRGAGPEISANSFHASGRAVRDSQLEAGRRPRADSGLAAPGAQLRRA